MAQHFKLKEESYPETHKMLSGVLKQAFKNGLMKNLETEGGEELVKGKFVKRLSDKHAFTEGATKAFLVSHIKLGAKFKNAFGKECISTPEKNALEVHTGSMGTIKAIYFVA